MNYPYESWLERTRKWVAFVGLSIGASIFWGVVVAGVVRYFFDISQDNTFYFVACPTALVFIVFFIVIRERLFQAMGFGNERIR